MQGVTNCCQISYAPPEISLKLLGFQNLKSRKLVCKFLFPVYQSLFVEASKPSQSSLQSLQTTWRHLIHRAAYNNYYKFILSTTYNGI